MSDLFAQPISSSYQRVVQFVSGALYNGTGSNMSGSSLTYAFEVGVSSGDGSPITTGAKGIKILDFTGRATQWFLVADAPSNVSASLWKANNTIPTTANNIFTASLANTTISSGSLNISVARGDVLRFEVMTNDVADYLYLMVKME